MSDHPLSSAIWHLWRRNGAIWLALLALLFASFGLAYVPLGAWNTLIGIAIAFVKAGLVVLLFMELIQAQALVRLAAAAGLFFLMVLFGLTTIDVIMRGLGK
jgi:cytochrome c oxidase subunit 4